MEIEVRLYATLRDFLPGSPSDFFIKKEIEEGTNISELAKLLGLPSNIPKIFVVSGKIVDENYVLKEGDVVNIFPPIAGGQLSVYLKRGDNMHIDDNPYYKELSEFIAQSKNEKGILIKTLYRAQNLFGYLPIEVQAFVAKELNLKFSQVFGVVTFYNFFRMEPVGKHVINVCLGTACHVKGAEDVLASISEELNVKVGGTTTDRLFTLSTARCFGGCGLAPCIMINEEVYGRLNPKKVVQILKEIRERENEKG